MGVCQELGLRPLCIAARSDFSDRLSSEKIPESDQEPYYPVYGQDEDDDAHGLADEQGQRDGARLS